MTVEIPSERTHVGNILENIECNDKYFLAALSYVRLDDNVNGMVNDFERDVAFLLPNDPVKNKKRRGHAYISYVSTPRTVGKGKVREKVNGYRSPRSNPSPVRLVLRSDTTNLMNFLH